MYEVVKGDCQDCALFSDCRFWKFNYIGPDYSEKIRKASKIMSHYNCNTEKAIELHSKVLKKVFRLCGVGKTIKLTYCKKKRF